jgi:hypothetical protein
VGGAMIEVPKLGGRRKNMNHKRVLGISLLCILLTSMITISAVALSRITRAYDYLNQYAAAAPAPTVTSGTNLSLLIYVDPEPSRPVLDLFQYVAAQNIEWRGTTIADPQGNIVSINVKITSVKFQKLSEDNGVGNATGLNVRVNVGDLLNVFVKADKVDFNLTYWSYLDTFPALNITGVLTGNVEVSFYFAVLPLPGLELALYQYKGDQFSISLCLIKPIDVTITAPSNGERISGDVKIQASVKTVPALSVDNVHCWIDGYKMPMQYNETSGLWESIFQSYNTGNGWHDLNVGAECIEWKSGQEFRYYYQDRINVEINNPWVNSYIMRDGGLEGFGGLKVNLVYDSTSWTMGTSFNFWSQEGLSLKAPEYWWDGKIRFICWRIDDENGNPLLESPDLTLNITLEIVGKLFDSDGRARELKCIYEEVPPPP